MKQTRPFRAIVTEQDKADLEAFAMGDGIQREIFFSTSGKLCTGYRSATAQYEPVFKTVHGQPFKWLDGPPIISTSTQFHA